MGVNTNIHSFKKSNQINIDKVNKNNNVLLHKAKSKIAI